MKLLDKALLKDRMEFRRLKCGSILIGLLSSPVVAAIASTQDHVALKIVRVETRCNSRLANRACGVLFQKNDMFECRNGPKCELSSINIYSSVNCRCGLDRYKWSIGVLPAGMSAPASTPSLIRSVT
jgi:hypothetical protein